MTRRNTGRRGEAPVPEARTLVVVVSACLGVGLMAFVLGMNFGSEKELSAMAQERADEGLKALDKQAVRLREVRRQQQAELSFHDSLSGPARASKKPRVVTPENDTQVSKANGNAKQETKADIATKVVASELNKDLPVAQKNPVDDGEAPPNSVETDSIDEGNADSKFSLQVGAFPDAKTAEALAGRLSGKGYVVRIASADVDGRGTWFRVRVGPFANRTSAESQRSRFANDEGLFALVVPER